LKDSYSWRNVKVAMLVRNFSYHGGLELYTYRLVQELLAHGLAITVICEKSEASLTHDNLKIVQIKPIKPQANKVNQLDHCIKEFTQAIDTHGPFDIVHSQHTAAHHIDVVTFHNHTISRLNHCGMPLEITLNKLKLLLRPDYIMRDEVDAMLAREARVLLFPSKICKQDFMERFKFQDNRNMASLTVAYPGWQLAESNSSDNNGNSQNSILNQETNGIPREKTIIFVGRGYRKKGLDVLLSACLLLKQRNYPFKLLIAGLKEKLLDRWQLNTFNLSSDVHYLGFVNDMEKVYQAGSIIASPSRIEPFGMAVLQAMSYGLVPVVSRIAGVSELLQNDTDALVIENHLDSEELADKLAFLLDQPQQLQAMSRAAQAKAQTISWKGTVDSTLNAYQQIFQRKYVY
jgi:glycosyltransferase involved in cell wall biosynthesis